KSSGTWTQVAEVGPSQRTYNDAALQPNTQYYYRIRTWNKDAYNVRCYSDYSLVMGQKTIGQTTYSAQTGKKPVVKKIIKKSPAVVSKP
ncbi:MAG: hypothetical protein ACM3PP_00540, partial [Candidatus Saccharibacteria bacterium]